MNYQKIWQKILAEGETVQHEFSISKRYRIIGMIGGGLVSLFFFSAMATMIILLLMIFFYFGFYLRVANAYAFTNKRVLIHRGWLSTHTTSIDYDKITDITVTEPFIDRIITQSGHLTVNTAGTGLHEVIIKHVDQPYELKKKLDALRSR